MENKKEKTLLESVEGQAVNDAVEAAKAEGKVAKSDLDDMFAFETADVDAEENEGEVAVGSWKFPGVRVQREPFNYNGQTLYSYVAKLRVKVNVGGEDHIHELRADFRVADKKNRNAYDLLALLYKSLPEGLCSARDRRDSDDRFDCPQGYAFAEFADFYGGVSEKERVALIA